MRIIILTALLFLINSSFAQDNFYSQIPLGDHVVGYWDTLIIDPDNHYDQYGNTEGTPFFVSVWHPVLNGGGRRYLTYEELRQRDLEEPYKTIYANLEIHMDSAYTWYNVSEDFDEYKEIKYKGQTAYDVQKIFKSIRTRTVRCDYQKRDFPVIFYHHGAQGLSDENYLMAEYFASHGYVFVSANFHWPFEGMTYGSSNNYEYNYNATRFVGEFAQSLTNSDKAYFFGHSWGAQSGFSVLYEDLGFDAFVSMETTLEYFDSVKISKTWPSLNKIMNEHKNDYSIPMLLFANSGKNYEFNFRFYEQIKNAPMIHATHRIDFGHESYTSIYLIRYLYRKIFRQPDNRSMKKQLGGYIDLLAIIKAFIESVDQDKEFDSARFQEDFFIRKYNQ